MVLLHSQGTNFPNQHLAHTCTGDIFQHLPLPSPHHCHLPWILWELSCKNVQGLQKIPEDATNGVGFVVYTPHLDLISKNRKGHQIPS